jgi:hypothetical protein
VVEDVGLSEHQNAIGLVHEPRNFSQRTVSEVTGFAGDEREAQVRQGNGVWGRGWDTPTSLVSFSEEGGEEGR